MTFDSNMHHNLARSLQDRIGRRKNGDVDSEGGEGSSSSPFTPVNIGFGLGGGWTPETTSPPSFGLFSTPLNTFGDPYNDLHVRTQPDRARQNWRRLLDHVVNSPVFGRKDSPREGEIAEVVDEPVQPASFSHAEVHHRVPLSRPVSPPTRGASPTRRTASSTGRPESPDGWGAALSGEPLDVEFETVTVIGPSGETDVYRPCPSADDSGDPPLISLAKKVHKVWLAPALTQIPRWFDQWWNGGENTMRPKSSSRASGGGAAILDKMRELTPNEAQIIKVSSAVVIGLLVALLLYVWYSNIKEDKESIVVPVAGDKKAKGFATYVPKKKYLKDRARGKNHHRHGKGSQKKGLPNPTQLPRYEYPPRWNATN